MRTPPPLGPAQLWGCLTLFVTANLLSTLAAKMMSSSFNRASHYTKMHDALKRVGAAVWVCVGGVGQGGALVGGGGQGWGLGA